MKQATQILDNITQDLKSSVNKLLWKDRIPNKSDKIHLLAYHIDK